MLDVGQRAPDFELPDQDGNPVSLSDFEGQRVVLYFYPKAKTRDCRREAQEFRDHYREFADRDVVVLGVSADPVSDIKEFAEEEDLPFTLLSDEDAEVCTAYESFGEREVAGEMWAIPYRNTYVIGPDGEIEATYEGVTAEEHPGQLLEDLQEMEAAGA